MAAMGLVVAYWVSCRVRAWSEGVPVRTMVRDATIVALIGLIHTQLYTEYRSHAQAATQYKG